MEKYDSVVVGGGPAGATAASLLAREGAKVLLIDKATFPREKLDAGILTHKSIRIIERLHPGKARGLQKKGILCPLASGFRIVHLNKIIHEQNGTYPFYGTRRFEFDTYLLKEAMATGASVVQGERVTAIDPDQGIVHTASGKRFTGDAIIGADGVHSVVRRALSRKLYSPRRWRRGLAKALQVFANAEDLPPFLPQLTLYLGFVPSGYAWFFPTGDRVILGIGGLTCQRKGGIAQAFRWFLDTIGYRGPKRFRGYCLPYGNYLKNPAYKRVFLVGDAAGFADPLLGEGIFYAIRSAEFAAANILGHGGESGRKYVKALRESHIFSDFFLAQVARILALSGLRFLGSLPLKIILDIGNYKISEVIHGYRRFTGKKIPLGESWPNWMRGPGNHKYEQDHPYHHPPG